MYESALDSNSFASLLFDRVISWILKDIGVDLSEFPANGISSTYDSRAFASIGYTLVNEKWTKKVSLHPDVEPSTVVGIFNTLSVADLQTKVDLLMKENQVMKETLKMLLKVCRGSRTLFPKSTLKLLLATLVWEN